MGLPCLGQLRCLGISVLFVVRGLGASRFRVLASVLDLFGVLWKLQAPKSLDCLQFPKAQVQGLLLQRYTERLRETWPQLLN